MSDTDTKKRPDWCQFEVVGSHRGRYILENGSWRGVGLATAVANEGIKFPHKGPDAVLWLVRDGYARSIATRAANHLGLVGLAVPFEEETGVHIQAATTFLEPNDGFVILPLGVECEVAPVDLQEGRSRPRVYRPELPKTEPVRVSTLQPSSPYAGVHLDPDRDYLKGV